jgi:uncharacterized protein
MSEQRSQARVSADRRWVEWTVRRGKALWVLATLFTLVAGWRTVQLYRALRSDLEDLLPQSSPSVVALSELRQRMPGIQHMGIVVDAGNATNLPAAERLLDDLAQRLQSYPTELVAAAHKDISAERQFAERHAALYADLADLHEVRRRIEARRDYEVAHAMEADLDDDPPPPLDFSDLEKRYRARIPADSSRFRADRFSSDSVHTSVLVIEIAGYSTGTDKAHTLLQRIRSDIAALGGVDHYAPGMRVGFAGDPAILVEELSALVGDLTVSSTLVIAAVIGAILLYYRWSRAVPALVLPLLVATVGAFGLASMPPLGIQALNSNTGFLGSIVVGNGINFGILLLARYLEERRNGSPVMDALTVAVSTSRLATLTAAAAAAVAYGSLMFTDFRGFWQFGVIGAIGMILCWSFTYLLMPSLLQWLDRSPTSAPRPLPPSTFRPAALIARFVSRFPRSVVAAGLGVTMVAAFGSRHFGPDRFETDFTKMRRRDSWINGDGYWGARMDAVLGRRLSPVVILTDSAAQTEQIEKAVREASGRPPLSEIVGEIRSWRDVVPEQQRDKLEAAQQIRDAVTPKMRSLIPAESRQQVDRFLNVDMHEISTEDLPATFAVGLRERDGTMDRALLIFAKPSASTWEGKVIEDFARELRTIAERYPGPGGRAARVAGQAPLSADLVDSMGRDGPKATAIALVGVVGLLIAMFRFRKETALVLGSLLIGVLWLMFASVALDIRINFCNFISFPITFGIGVDYAVNVMGRYRLDGGRDVVGAIRSTGGAVGLASATTVIGYSSLLLAKNQALFSFGALSVLGELTCLTTGVVLLPALLLLMDRHRASHAQ